MGFKLETLIVNEGDPKKATITCINSVTGNRLQINCELSESEAASIDSICQQALQNEFNPPVEVAEAEDLAEEVPESN